jgi:PAS domain S-box-containing protein
MTTIETVSGPSELRDLSYAFNQMSEKIESRESALRESEQLYRAIGESIDYGIWICDPDGRNTYASKSFLDLVGVTQKQCSNFGWSDVLHPDDVERTVAAWKECVRTGSIWDIEHRFKGVDGQWHFILARVFLCAMNRARSSAGQALTWI